MLLRSAHQQVLHRASARPGSVEPQVSLRDLHSIQRAPGPRHGVGRAD